MEVDTFDWSFVPLVDLDNMLRTQIVQFDLFVVRTGSNAVAKRMKLDLMNHSSMFLVGLNRFLSVQVPNMDHLIVAGDHVSS